MADLVTWSPRVGSTGDDRYDPGETPVIAGSSASLSSPPTVDEINDTATGINQIYAEIYRRYLAITYVSAGARINRNEIVLEPPHGNIPRMVNYTDYIRATEGWSAFAWSGSWGIDPYGTPAKFSRQMILEIRKALATDRYRIPSIETASLVYAGSSASAQSGSTVGGTGAYELGLLSSGSKWRVYKNFVVPAGVPSCGTCKLFLPYYRTSTTIFGVRAYRSNTYLGTITGADWGNLDNLEGTVDNDDLATNRLTWYDMAEIPLTSAHEGGNSYSYIIADGREVDGETTPSQEDYIPKSHSTTRRIILELVP